jgi:hypothetical protein
MTRDTWSADSLPVFNLQNKSEKSAADFDDDILSNSTFADSRGPSQRSPLAAVADPGNLSTASIKGIFLKAGWQGRGILEINSPA